MQRAGLAVENGPQPENLLRVQAERAETLVDVVEASRAFYEDFQDYDEKAAKRHLLPAASAPLQDLLARLEALSDWQPDALGQAVQATVDALGIGFGKIGMPLRVALKIGRASCRERVQR